MGAKVIKIEDQKFGDPFKQGLFGDMDPSFEFWYKSLNQYKQIETLDFNSAEDKKYIHELINKADAILMGIPPKVQAKLSLESKTLASRGKVIIEMKASRNDEEALHDLNALAKTGLLGMHIEDHQEDILYPPFLPVSGIIFGHRIAMATMAALLKALRKKEGLIESCYLLESTKESLTPFYNEELRKTGETKFLHNGKFPCYALYRLKDGHYAALAAVEEKFWVAFTKVLNLEIRPEERFHYKDDSIFQKVSAKLKSLDSKQLQELSAGTEMCLNIL
jgi:crotonobetainyl-CoA:carnitine CoA-transferase CaiB-like acyl-CoA transferase